MSALVPRNSCFEELMYEHARSQQLYCFRPSLLEPNHTFSEIRGYAALDVGKKIMVKAVKISIL